MVRQVAFLMRASKGALRHSDIMSLSWRQFGVYLDSFTWLLREEGDDKQREKNQKADREAMRSDPRVKQKVKSEADEVKAKLAAFNEQWKGKAGKINKVM